jgi:hypothetical protein
MKYELTSPCGNCPFRHNVKPYLRAERVEEIRDGLVRGEFPCHKTTVDTGDGNKRETEHSQHCAGALILKESLGESSQMMRICERLGMYDRTKLNMEAPVFSSWEDMIEAQFE